MRLDQLHPPMKVSALYDTGLKTGDIQLYEVLKVDTAKVKLRDEFGREGWVYPDMLHGEISEERYEEIMAESHGPDWRSRRAGGGETAPATGPTP